jgi:DNA-binding beta-propeller fold protein YncE
VSPGGDVLAQFGKRGDEPGQFYNPSDVAVDDQGNIYVTDSGHSLIQKLSPTGQPLAKWGKAGIGPGEFHSLNSIALDSQGNIYVTDTWNQRVQKLVNPKP